MTTMMLSAETFPVLVDSSVVNRLVFVDCEAVGPCPSMGKLTEFGAVRYSDRTTFHGVIYQSRPSTINPAIPVLVSDTPIHSPRDVFADFAGWLPRLPIRPFFVSDNPAFDWQWINDGFHSTLGFNPFGFSARRIGDFYAGLVRDFSDANSWKRLRVTRHTHNPVDDAMGNVEAFDRMLAGERP